jgi:hypothetical protein
MKFAPGLLFICQCIFMNAVAQNDHARNLEQVAARTNIWNRSYNSRDSVTFFSLFDSTAIVVSLGGKWVGLEKCKYLCRSLYVKRPDINFSIYPTKIEVNDQWPTAYATGDWSESWTEAGDTTKSEIKGKYWMMWQLKNGTYYILSAIFTPLSCSGSYCNK